MVNNMLIEFRVQNFRSLRDEQVLSFVATTDNTLLNQNTFPSGIKAAPELLRSMVLYGPNAAGKSNIIKALQYMCRVIAESANLQAGHAFNVQAFRLDTESNKKPTVFEVSFLLDGIRHQYGFSLNSERILSEYLLVYKAFKPQQWFARHYDSKTNQYHYEFGAGLKGKKSVWESTTRPNSLFLSMAVHLNSEQLRPIFDFFVTKLIIVGDDTPLNPLVTIDMLKQPESNHKICDFLNAADISIAAINVVPRKVPGQTLHFDLQTGKTEKITGEVDTNELHFYHKTEKGEATFNLPDESKGTRQLLFLTGPIFDIIDKGLILIIDELDSSLHPLLVQRLVKLFHTPSLNTKGAQLIFTTHDTSLLSSNLFRRDQIWFVEKDNEQASKLYSLSEFSPRKNEALESGYFKGRYGGLPLFREWHK